MEIALLIIGLIIGCAVGINLGRHGRPAYMEHRAADAIVRFICAVERSHLSREGVAVVKQTVTDTYDPDVAVYIQEQLRQSQLRDMPPLTQ